ncbi:MAG: hypothetical protein CMN72_12195 [Sphingomonas sp.]|nr:hypothetical protein [Sphingomonas sp.]
MTQRMLRTITGAVAAMALLATPALAHRLRTAKEAATVAGSDMSVTPDRDWNRLSMAPGKHAETWTLDGEQLNDVTFYGGIAPDEPLVRERSKKRDPLPKFLQSTLLVEIPELLEGTYRTQKNIASFELLSTEPTNFLDNKGVRFTYRYTDDDALTRNGEARAAIVGGKLYMITFDAPRLYYFDKSIEPARALMTSATLPGGGAH